MFDEFHYINDAEVRISLRDLEWVILDEVTYINDAEVRISLKETWSGSYLMKSIISMMLR